MIVSVANTARQYYKITFKMWHCFSVQKRKNVGFGSESMNKIDSSGSGKPKLVVREAPYPLLISLSQVL
jgi:hypothetical protein